MTARIRRSDRPRSPLTADPLLFAIRCVPPLPVQTAWLAAPAGRSAPLAVFGEDARVLAACPAALEAGVRAGHRLAQARLRCPAVQVAQSDCIAATVLYEDLLAALGTIFPLVEAGDPVLGSIYLGGRGLERLVGDAPAIARAALRAAAAVGLAVRAGAGPTRLLARLAAARIPDGTSLTPAQARRLLHALPLADAVFALPGPLLQQFDDLGVRTAGALAELPRAALVLRFDAGVLALWDLLAGAPEPPLRPWSPPVVRTARRACDDGLDNRLILEALLHALAQAVLSQLQSHGEAAAQLTLRIQRADGTRLAARSRHWPPLCAAGPLQRAAMALLDRLLRAATAEPLSLLRLDAGAVGPNPGLQSPLFGEPVAARRQRLNAVLANQADRHGAAVLGRWRADPRAPDGWTHEDGLP